jgi:hypothetical protein
MQHIVVYLLTLFGKLDYFTTGNFFLSTLKRYSLLKVCKFILKKIYETDVPH